MLNCKTGEDFERLVLDTLQTLNFEAYQTGREDRGVDIIAFKTVDGHRYRFDIQCKFWNTTVGMKPIQEVYAGSHYFNQGGTPVVFTNNRVTLEARQYARRLSSSLRQPSRAYFLKPITFALQSMYMIFGSYL